MEERGRLTEVRHTRVDASALSQNRCTQVNGDRRFYGDTNDLQAAARHRNLAGAAIFLIADRMVEAKFGGEGSGNPMGIVVGAIVDGVPESLIFGIAVTSGEPISIALVAAVWISNLPRAMAPSSELAKQGRSWIKTGGMWAGVVVACALTALLGYAIGVNSETATGAGAAAIAAGGVIAMLTDSLLPFAYSKGGRPAGFWAVVGFALTLLVI